MFCNYVIILHSVQKRRGKFEILTTDFVIDFICDRNIGQYLQVLPLGGSRDEKWRRQGTGKRSVSWNLPKQSQLWRCNGGFGPRTTQNTYGQNNSWVVVHEIPVDWLPVLVDSAPRTQKKFERFSIYWYALLRRDNPGYCTAEVGNPGGAYELPCIYCDVTVTYLDMVVPFRL
jgi:hypothetical protein